jgi:hypothetical protein
MIPTPIIVLLFIAAFLLTTWQYLQIDPRRRILNLRFGVMLGALAAAFGYPIYKANVPNDLHASWLLLALGLIWLAIAYYLWRHTPPRER